MITTEIILNTEYSLNSVAAGTKIIMFAQIIDETFSFKYDLKFYESYVTDYFNAKPIPNPLDINGNRIKGKNWITLSDEEKMYIFNKVEALGLSVADTKKMRFGEMARYIYKYTIAHLRSILGYWAVIETEFENYYVESGSTSIPVEEGYIVDRILLENNTDSAITYTISCGDYLETNTLISGAVEEITVNHLSLIDETLIVDAECDIKVIVKADDMSAYIPTVEEIIEL